jgi:hypothetical protein
MNDRTRTNAKTAQHLLQNVWQEIEYRLDVCGEGGNETKIKLVPRMTETPVQ